MESHSREIINGNVTESGINEAKRIWMGRGIVCLYRIASQDCRRRKLKTVDAGPLNLDVEVLNFKNHAGFDVTSVVVHSCGA